MINSNQFICKTGQEDSIFLGKGGFGCVVYPMILDQCVSKIVLPKSKGLNDRKKECKQEFNIYQTLKNIDPEQIYYLGPSDLSVLNTKQMPSKLFKKMRRLCGSKCFPYPNKSNYKAFLHMSMPFGYPMSFILSIYPSLTLMIKSFAHLVRAIQKIVDSTDVILMDIKQSNIVYRLYQDKYLHPVFIDYGPHHIISSHQTLNKYVTKWKQFKYHTWSPEIRCAMIRSHSPQKTKNELTKFVLDNYEQHCAKFLKDEKKINILNVCRRYKRKHEISHDIFFSSNIILNQMKKSSIPKETREKIMIWSLANSYLGSAFYRLIMRCLHPNIIKRMNCDQILKIRRLRKVSFMQILSVADKKHLKKEHGKELIKKSKS